MSTKLLKTIITIKNKIFLYFSVAFVDVYTITLKAIFCFQRIVDE